MIIHCNVTGSERKRLVDALGAALLMEPIYKKAPTFAYVVSDYTIDKNGTIFCPVSATVEDVAGIVAKLEDEGFTTEIAGIESVDEDDSFEENPIDKAAADISPKTPDAAEETAAEEQPATENASENIADDMVTDTNGTRLIIRIPRSKLPDEALSRLKQIVTNKQSLLKRAVSSTAVPIVIGEKEVSFPWFTLTGVNGEATAYAQFIAALCQMAREQKRILDKPYDGDNDRFTMRIFMVRLGMKGAQFALARKLMMKNLSGNSGWRYGTPTETISIYWNDLTPEKQQELFEALGDNGNYDVHPLAEIPVLRKEPEDESV